MNTFVILSVLFSVILMVLSALAGWRQLIGRSAAAAWCLLWAAAAAAICYPEASAHLARWLGIRRGADLVSYVAILAMFVGFFRTYIVIRRIEADLTSIVRELAIVGASRDARPD